MIFKLGIWESSGEAMMARCTSESQTQGTVLAPAFCPTLQGPTEIWFVDGVTGVVDIHREGTWVPEDPMAPGQLLT